MSNGEQWKQYPKDQRYEVSTLGRVRMAGSDGPRKTKRIAQMRYHAVTFAFNGHHVSRYVHEMVLETFHGPRPPQAEASHIDGDVNNNCASNLAWESRAANLARRKCIKLTHSDVAAIRAGAPLRPIAVMRGIRVDSLYKVRRGERWKIAPCEVPAS